MRAILMVLTTALFLSISAGSVSAANEPAATEEILCGERLIMLRGTTSRTDFDAHQRLTYIEKACGILVQLRNVVTLSDFDHLRRLIEYSEVSLSELGTSKEELAAFELKVLPQKMRKVFKNTAHNLSDLESALEYVYEGALDGFKHRPLTDRVADLLWEYQEVSDALRREIPSYYDRIVLCATQAPLPDMFWALVDDTAEAIVEAGFGTARAMFGRAHGQLTAYNELAGLCVKSAE